MTSSNDQSMSTVRERGAAPPHPATRTLGGSPSALQMPRCRALLFCDGREHFGEGRISGACHFPRHALILAGLPLPAMRWMRLYRQGCRRGASALQHRVGPVRREEGCLMVDGRQPKGGRPCTRRSYSVLPKRASCGNVDVRSAGDRKEEMVML